MNDFATTTQGLVGFLNTLEFLQFEVWGNTGSAYAGALIAFLIFWILLKVLQIGVIKKLKSLSEKTETDIDDTFIEIVETLKPPFFSFVSFYLATFFLALPTGFQEFLDILLLVWVVYQAIHALSILVSYILKRRMHREDDPGSQSALKFLNSFIKGILWVLGALLILQNMGVNISALLAGLGVGGIAIAFALQNVLEDLFSSFSIHFDKPFVVGDFIKVGDYVGEVKRIGIKTTRVQALQGEEVIISNRELTSTKIQNFGRMNERRISTSFGVTYGTSNEKLRKIRSIVSDILSKRGDDVRFDRVHFKSFGASELAFELVYFVTTDDYARYMDIQEELNLELKAAFEEEGIEFAYPTQTLFIEK